MKCKKTEYQEREMTTADIAGGYVRRMVEREARGWGDQENALSRLEARYGLPFWTLNHLRTGRAKTVEAGIFARLRAAYLDLCANQIRLLEHEIAVEKAMNEDASLEDLEREAADLVARVQAKKAALKAGKS